jgi:uncharacterized protein
MSRSPHAALTNPNSFFAAHRERLTALDGVQFVPNLFTALRPEIDAHRQLGCFLLLGSVQGALLQQSAESLADRVG